MKNQKNILKADCNKELKHLLIMLLVLIVLSLPVVYLGYKWNQKEHIQPVIRIIKEQNISQIFQDNRFYDCLAYPDGSYPYKTDDYVIVFKIKSDDCWELINKITKEAPKQLWQE